MAFKIGLDIQRGYGVFSKSGPVILFSFTTKIIQQHRHGAFFFITKQALSQSA